MGKMLSTAGLPSSITDRIPDVINSCRECRAWSKAGNKTVSTLSLPTRFNESVEGDLLFYRTIIVLQMVDRCTRWHAGQLVDSKHEQVLLDSQYPG